jgi:hypothetical protein
VGTLALGLTTTFTPTGVLGDGWQLTLRQARPGTQEIPLVVEVASAIPTGTYKASGPGASRPIIASVFEDGGKKWLGIVLPPGAAQETHLLRSRSPKDDGTSGQVALEPHGPRILIRLDQDPIAEYRTDVGPKPFLFPLIGPTGVSYTRAYPMETVPDEDRDHPHQRSFWFTHGKVNNVDFWSEENGNGSIKETRRKTVLSGPVLARLRTTDDWLGPDGRKVCEDERLITVFRTRTNRVIDFEITLKATSGKVVFGDTKEGMFGLRVASSMDVKRKQGGKITNALGLTDEAAWGKASPWVDYTGPVQGKTVGIAVLNHPRSFRYPTTWHVRTYGLFAANPFGWHDFGLGRSGEYTLPEGEALWFGYRVILHAGDTRSARVAEAFAHYGQRIMAELTAN